MSHCRAIQVFAIAILAAVQLMSSTHAGAQNVGVRQVQIKSSWGGLGMPAASELTIMKQGSKFRLGHTTIDPQLLAGFLTALREPDIPEIDLSNLGITQEWLIRNHEGPLSQYQGGPEVRARNQQALYRERFENPAYISPLLSRVYKSGFHTDDYPSVQVRLTFEDGSDASLSSNSQQPFMAAVGDRTWWRNTCHIQRQHFTRACRDAPEEDGQSSPNFRRRVARHPTNGCRSSPRT